MSIYTEEKKPLVSVVMPAYNAELFIEEAIMSVVNQTVSDWELIVVDDCSQDNTVKIVQKMAEKDSRIQLIKNDVNMMVSKTRNLGIEISQGKYVALLDSDDYWKPNFLERIVLCIEKSNADLVYCSYELVGEQGQKVCNDFIVPLSTTFDEAIVRSAITCSTVLMKSEIAKNNPFPTNVYHEDITLWFTLLRDGKIARGDQTVLASYRQRSGSRSSDKIRSARKRWIVYRKHLKLPFFKSVFVMIKYAYYGILKFRRV